jgi:hypothetical protein
LRAGGNAVANVCFRKALTGITRATRRLDLRSSKSATGYSFFRLLSGFVASTQRNSKEILLVSKKTIPLRVKADADVREVFWFAGRRFIGKGTPNQVFEGQRPLANTKSPRWTTTAAPVRIASLCE